MINPRPGTGWESYQFTGHGKWDQMVSRWPSTQDKTSQQAIPYPEMTPLTPLIKLLQQNSPVNAKKLKEAIEKEPPDIEQKRKKKKQEKQQESFGKAEGTKTFPAGSTGHSKYQRNFGNEEERKNEALNTEKITSTPLPTSQRKDTVFQERPHPDQTILCLTRWI